MTEKELIEAGFKVEYNIEDEDYSFHYYVYETGNHFCLITNDNNEAKGDYTVSFFEDEKLSTKCGDVVKSLISLIKTMV